MLSDRTIRRLMETGEQLDIRSWDVEIADEQFQPASFDLRIGEILGRAKTYSQPPWEAPPPNSPRGWWVPVHSFWLGSTIETLCLGRQLVGRVEGKSSWARRGLMVHCAGFVDPGFHGQITLELFNLGPAPVWVEEGKRIAQICFDWLDTVPSRVYGDPGLRSRYLGQHGPTPAREWSGNDGRS